MRYINTRNFDHKQADKIGILITNLGTPDEPTPKALKRYLKQFLSDPRVVEVPRVLWWLILNGVILQFRPRRSAKAYATVFTDQGSPLLFNTQAQSDAIAAQLQQQGGVPGQSSALINKIGSSGYAPLGNRPSAASAACTAGR